MSAILTAVCIAWLAIIAAWAIIMQRQLTVLRAILAEMRKEVEAAMRNDKP